jgi:hypothetical protein
MDELDERSATTCGQEVAASAEVPEAWRDLMRHVAINLEAHAAWVGTGSPAAREEHDGLRRVAAAYLEMAEAADRASRVMRALRAVPAAPHDPARHDVGAFVAWMRKKVELQRTFAAMLERHAAESERALGKSA